MLRSKNNMWSSLHTIVINLSQDTERKAFMESQLTRYKIPFTVLTAVDGRTFAFNDEYDEQRAIKEHGRPLSAPEKGCALSHRRALQAFLDSGKPYGLIMEDDVVLHNTFVPALEYTLGASSEWSYVQFNYGPVGMQGIYLWWFLLRKSKPALHKLPLLILKGIAANILSLLWGVRNIVCIWIEKQRLARLMRDQYLAGCYLVTREAAQALINLNTPLTYTADRVQNIARRRKVIRERIYVPRIVRQKREDFASSIQNEHFGNSIIAA